MPLVDWYRRNRARSAALFDLLDDEAYYGRPIALRQPVVFYEGHLPAFSFNTLVKRGLGRPSIDARLESLFARGIDPEETAASAQASADAALADPRTGEGLRRRGGRTGAGCAGARRHRSAGSSPAPPQRSGAVHPRARGDAPGNAALHVASDSVFAEAAALRLRPAGRGRRRRPMRGCRCPRARPRSAWTRRANRSPGTTSVRHAWHRCRRSPSSGTT